MMKIIFYIVLVAGMLVSGVLMANAPNAIHASYDLEHQKLHVTVQHHAADRNGHFIKEVVIFKNGTEVARRDFDFQTSHRNQAMSPFAIPAGSGDTFRIIATCNDSGLSTQTIVVK
ncbi:MAG: hypothetical protein V2A66_10690 [Pseudomonadota bacterium]